VDTFHDLHVTVGWFFILSNAVVGVWATVAQYVEPLRHRSLWLATAIAQLSAFATALFGVVLVSAYDRELDQFHALYGFSTIIAIGILYSYRTSPFIKDKQHLLYGLGGLFLMGLGIRALFLD
jgi:hypothetical protein